MNANIEIVLHDFLKNNFLDLRGLWFGRQRKKDRKISKNTEN